MKKQVNSGVTTENESSIQDNLNVETSRLNYRLEGPYLIDVLRAFWNDREPPRPPEGFNEKSFWELVNFQRVAAMVADELDKRPEWFSERFRRAMTQSRAIEVARDVAFHTTRAKVEALFEENEIRYLPLKGAIMKGLYPQTYQRPARDYDVLLDESEILRAEALLMRKYGYKEEGVDMHHYALKNDKGLMEVELHRFLLGRDRIPIIVDPWSRALPDPDESSGKKLRFKFTNEDFYLHMVVHLAKHWSHNGASIRAFVDVWVFNQKFGDSFDRASLDKSLRKLGIFEFTRNVERAGRVWFGDLESDEIVDVMARHLFNPTMFGAAIQPTEPKSRIREFFDAFLLADYFKCRYLEERRRSFVGRIWWRVQVWTKFTLQRLTHKRNYARMSRFLFRGEYYFTPPQSNGDTTRRKNFERSVGYVDVPCADSQDDAKRFEQQEEKR